MSTISLNSVVYGSGGRKGPSGIQIDPVIIGISLPAANGTRNYVRRGVKQQWNYEWDGVSTSLKADIYALIGLTSTFAHIDIDGVSWTCQCEESDFKATVTNVLPTSVRWRVNLTVRQS